MYWLYIDVHVFIIGSVFVVLSSSLPCIMASVVVRISFSVHHTTRVYAHTKIFHPTKWLDSLVLFCAVLCVDGVCAPLCTMNELRKENRCSTHGYPMRGTYIDRWIDGCVYSCSSAEFYTIFFAMFFGFFFYIIRFSFWIFVCCNDSICLIWACTGECMWMLFASCFADIMRAANVLTRYANFFFIQSLADIDLPFSIKKTTIVVLLICVGHRWI